jgi:hypothetical protein
MGETVVIAEVYCNSRTTFKIFNNIVDLKRFPGEDNPRMMLLRRTLNG